jgi:hypothetical protein
MATVWAKGGQESRAANMLRHFDGHGVSMGYKNAASYTAGALKNIATSRASGVLKSGSRAFISNTRVTLTYKGALSSFYKSKNALQWFKNARR